MRKKNPYGLYYHSNTEQYINLVLNNYQRNKIKKSILCTCKLFHALKCLIKIIINVLILQEKQASKRNV